jgi:voltage-gated potassium channel
LLAVLTGTFGYYAIGRYNGTGWDLFECLYMTVITLTTVGYGETLDNNLHQVSGAREFTIFLIIFGMGSFLYFASNVTAILIEGDLKEAFRKKRMLKKIEALEDHIIVCGIGTTGSHVIRELMATNTPVVAIDTNEERLEAIATEYGESHFLYIVGDATDDDVLEQAQLVDAGGLVAALASDKDNLYLVVTARQCNPDCRIVARATELSVLEKIKKAGADSCVSPNYIGGMRMVSEMIRPTAVKFLDVMLRDRETPMRIEDVVIGDASPYVGVTLRDTDMRKEHKVSVLAVEDPGGGGYIYNPDADMTLVAGMKLVVMGPVANVKEMRRRVRG